MALNLKQKLLGAYFLVEEQYYGFVDWLEARERYEFTDYFVTPIEERGVPSFVVFLSIILLLLLGVFFLFLQPPPAYASFEVTLYNGLTNEKVDGFVTLEAGGKTLAASETSGGSVYYEKIPTTRIELRAESAGFENYEKTIDAGKTRSFVARLTPVGGIGARNLLMQQITDAPGGDELPPLSGGYGYGTWGDEEINPTYEPGAEPSAEPTPSLEPNASIEPQASPTPLSEETIEIAVGSEASFQGINIKVLDVSEASVFVDLKNASTGAPLFTQVLIQANETFSGVQRFFITFLGRVGAQGSYKARFLLQFMPEPTATPPAALSVRITNPQSNNETGENLTDALVQIQVEAWASEPIDKVEVSTDNGTKWGAATLASESNWTFNWLTPNWGVAILKARLKTTGGEQKESEPVRVIVSPCKKLYYYGETDKIDLVFTPSKFTESLDFKQSIDAAIGKLREKTLFSNEPQKSKINVFYYAFNVDCTLQGRIWDCDLPLNYFASCGFADATAVIVKSNEYGGCAEPGARILAYSSSNAGLFTHELGHALFGLADRYCCDGGYWQTSEKPNLWSQQPACSEYVSMILERETECRRIINYVNPLGPPNGINWFEQPDQSNMQKLEFDFDESDEARIKYILEKPTPLVTVQPSASPSPSPSTSPSPTPRPSPSPSSSPRPSTSPTPSPTPSPSPSPTPTSKPTVAFVPPTPNNGATVGVSYVFVNATAIDAFYSISSCTLEWQSANYSMTKAGSGKNVYCYSNKTGLANGFYYYKVYAQNSAGRTGETPQRSARVSVTPTPVITSIPTPKPSNPANPSPVQNT